MLCQFDGCVTVSELLVSMSKNAVQTSPAGIPTGMFKVMLAVELEL
jgi:hypothetical protein